MFRSNGNEISRPKGNSLKMEFLPSANTWPLAFCTDIVRRRVVGTLRCERMSLRTHNRPFNVCLCCFSPSEQCGVALFPFPASFTHHVNSLTLSHQLFNLLLVVHCSKCQSSVEAAYLCSAKWDRIPVVPADGPLPSETADSSVVVCLFYSNTVGFCSSHFQLDKNSLCDV